MSAADFYERVAAEYDRAEHERFYGRLAEETLALVPPDPTVRSILEVGAGTGFGTAVLRERYPDAEIVALEPAPAMLARAARRVPDARFECSTLAEYRLTREPDLVACFTAAHWLSEQERRRLKAFGSVATVAACVPTALPRPLPAGNALLADALLRHRALPAWRPAIRHEDAVGALLPGAASRHVRIDEAYPCLASMLECLRVRGALLALFGNESEAARRVIEAEGASGPIAFSWSFRCLARPRGITPDAARSLRV